MTRKTVSEALFEAFCQANAIACEPVPTGATPTPDYRVHFGGTPVYVEVKQLDLDDDFSTSGDRSTRTVGDHLRAKIGESRRQAKFGSALGAPTILLVYNNIDPIQAFGTEVHDFLTAMYGELTVRLERGRVTESFFGRNASFREEKNISFSAIGHLKRTSAGSEVTIYENVFARDPLDYAVIPEVVKVVRIEVVANAA